MINDITVSMDKFYNIKVDNYIPFMVKTFDQLITNLSQYNFNIIRFQFDNSCYPGADEKLRNKEYKKYMNRINKIANALGKNVILNENQIISGHVFQNKFTVVLG